jgi:glutamate carboxypeptidase
MDKWISTLLSSLQERYPIMVDQLHQWCEINSSSDNLPGLSLMRDTLQKAFSPVADSIESRAFPPRLTINRDGEQVQQVCGDLLYLRKRPHLKKRILLCGHMDTVYADTHPFQNLKYIDDHRINGPGVADMKGGLIVMLHALIAFEATPYASELGWDVIINADEEIGSPVSGPLLMELSETYQAALVYEPAMTSHGTFAKNRRGSGKLSLIAKGKAAHVGRAFHEGQNAICLLAEAITAIHALNGQRDGVTVNVGLVTGGEAINVVPDRAVAHLDIRIQQACDEAWVRDQLSCLLKKITPKDDTFTLHGHFGRPVKRVNPATEQWWVL